MSLHFLEMFERVHQTLLMQNLLHRYIQADLDANMVEVEATWHTQLQKIRHLFCYVFVFLEIKDTVVRVYRTNPVQVFDNHIVHMLFNIAKFSDEIYLYFPFS